MVRFYDEEETSIFSFVVICRIFVDFGRNGSKK